MSGSIGGTMEVLVFAVIAFAGALLAAVATGALIVRFRSEPSGWLGAWIASTAALCLSLGVTATGHLVGFGPTTFRLYQLTGSLVAPVWLAIGVIQLLALKIPSRFAAWLVGGAFTFVSSIILILDPVAKEEELGQVLPLGSEHWGTIPGFLLAAAHAGVVITLVASLVIAILRWREGDDYDTDNMHAVLVLGPAGIAVVGGVRFAVPGIFAAILLIAAAAGIWYVLIRPLAPYDDDEDEDDDEDDEPYEEERAPSRRAVAEQPPRRRAQVSEQLGERAGGRGGDQVAAQHGMSPAGRGANRAGAPAPGQRVRGGGRVPADGRIPAEQHMQADGRMPAEQHMQAEGRMSAEQRMQAEGRMSAEQRLQGPPQRPPGGRRSGLGDLVAEYRAGEQDVDYAARMQPGTGEHGGPRPSRAEDPLDPRYAPRTDDPFEAQHHPVSGEYQAYGMPPSGAPAPGHGPGRRSEGRRARQPEPEYGRQDAGAAHPDPGYGAAGGRPSPSIYGLLTVFTLMDGVGDAFDRLAEETVEGVRRNEPDSLIYACHAVKSAPLQRIIYELYRDEVAYTDHQRQPHVARFVAERAPLVLATNVIELSVNAAKVVPLPTAFQV
jgi:quinol monooxygenase YgiN